MKSYHKPLPLLLAAPGDAGPAPNLAVARAQGAGRGLASAPTPTRANALAQGEQISVDTLVCSRVLRSDVSFSFKYFIVRFFILISLPYRLGFPIYIYIFCDVISIKVWYCFDIN